MSLFKKRISLMCAVSAMMLSSVLAPEVYAEASADMGTSSGSAENASATVFTIDNAINYAKEHSSTLAAAKASEEYAKSSCSETSISRKILRDNPNYAATDISSALLLNGYTYEYALMGYRSAQRAVIQTEYTLESSVSSLFYTYLSNAEKVKIAENSLSAATERAQAAEVRHSNGFISDLDMELFNLSELQAQNDLAAQKRNLELSMMNFKAGINYPQDQPLELSGTFTRPSKETTSYESAVKKAENSITRANAEDTLNLAERKFKAYHMYYSPNQPGWYSANAEYENAKLTYTNSVNTERINLYSAWSGVQSVYEALEALDKSYETTQKQADAAKLSYEMGTVSANDYLDKERDVYSAKNTLLDTELQAYIANEQYRSLFDCENTVFEEGNK